MSDLNYKDKLLVEKLFGMSSGYVLDFSNHTFQEFIFQNISIDIYDSKYDYSSGSKANRLRAFFQKETNYKVAVIIDSLLDYWHTKAILKEHGFDISNKDL